MAVYFTFWKGERFFALGIESVEGVTRLDTLTPADWGPNWLVGFSFFRGQTVPVVDLEAYLGEPRPVPFRYLVVCGTEENLGFGASRLGQQYDVDTEPEPVEGLPPGVLGQLLLGGRSALVLNPALILKEGGQR
ncbi:chemotaxis protein CheW [Thermosulfurimonas sp. F29]|uniref:chemotaxis protein CheW n=1 Tax=Thermosulfurimonas sp. F29 TaxID=2867247 RepID=UPI001C82D9D7|nr:chemotaxis protein CheW [Thermosulfurimonas sp. F29]MBX6423546.1 chemotaxis protein CheW [Thermosulfurimonas sp. F29]